MARLLAALLVVAAKACAQDGQAAPDLSLSGYLKNLAIQSSTLAGPERSYLLDVSRARLKLQGPLAPAASLDLQYDNELLAGSYLHTAQFALQQQQASGQYWRAEQRYLARRDVQGRHRLYRASLTVRHGATDVKVGRQRIAWGTGRFWSPLDVLNPIAATQLEREERPGVDALLVEHKLGPLERLSVVYAPAHARHQASAAAHVHGNGRGIDYSLAWGKFGDSRLLGADLATQLGGFGVRAEAAQLRPAAGRGYRRMLLGLDYAFGNTLTLSAELFRNGGPAAAAPGRRYAGAYAGYELTPLWKVSLYAVRNLSDRSHYLSPSITCSLRSDLEWALGFQQFGGGRRDSEFGRVPDVLYSHLQWFF